MDRTDVVAGLVKPWADRAVEHASRAVADALAHARLASPTSHKGRASIASAKARILALPGDLAGLERSIAVHAWTRVARSAWDHYREALGDLAHPEERMPEEYIRQAIRDVRINGVRPLAGLTALAQEHERALHGAWLGLVRGSDRRLDTWSGRARSALTAAATQVLYTGAYRVEYLTARLATQPQYLHPDPTLELTG